MKLSTEKYCDGQIQMLRRQLQTQREQIAFKLSATPAENKNYPRSITMRFLTRPPAFATSLFKEFAALVIGAGLIRSIVTAINLNKIVRSVSTNK